jgi:hypothetical protein
MSLPTEKVFKMDAEIPVGVDLVDFLSPMDIHSGV